MTGANQKTADIKTGSVVSIIIPTYNCADFLPETIESVKAQTHPHWELLILDDGSTDDTESVVRPYLLDDRIRYFKLAKQDSCGARVRNIGFTKSTGDYICYLDSDDLLYPDALQVLLKPLLKNERTQYSKAFFTCIDEYSREIRNRGIHLIRLYGNDNEMDGNDKGAPQYAVPPGFRHDLKTMMDVQFSIQLATVLFRREALVKLGPFREDLSHSDDFEFFIRMVVDDPSVMETVPAYTLKYRIRSTALTSDVSKLSALIGCHIRVLNDIYAWQNLPEEAIAYKNHVFVNSYRRAARNQLNVRRPQMVWYLARLAWNDPSIEKIELIRQFWSILLQASLPMILYFQLVTIKDWLRRLRYQQLTPLGRQVLTTG
ncbi:MAG: glycosyltransferase [Vampirovibrionales bacterium]|nr:glycosyltransferase [Vampirovibrionales bacterium]